MKTISSILFLFILLGQVFSQTANQPDGCVPLTVQFTAPSGSSTHFWDFKDGGTSNLANPSNTYLNTGTYDVEYRERANGPLVGTVQIQVFSKPDPMITVDQSKGCAPLFVQFSDATNLSPSVSVNNYSWVFEDGGTATGSSVNHTFTSPGNFWVSLELNTSLPSCNVTKQFNNYINVSAPPNASFTTNPDPPSSCTAPLSVSFTNTSTASSTLSYRWDLGNGVTSTNTDPGTANYSQDGLYQVKLVATDTNSCSDSSIRIVSVGSPIADIQMPDTICLGKEVTIKNFSSTGVYGWSLDGATFIRYINNRDLLIQFNTPGPKTIGLNVRVGNCVADTSISTFVEDPSADFTSSPEFSCSLPLTINFDALQSGLDYHWNFDELDTSIEKSPSYTFPFPNGENPYTVNKYQFFKTTLKVTSNFGCEAEESRTDTLFRPTALMMPNEVKGCLPLSVTFSDSSISIPRDSLVKWEWFFGDGTSVTNTKDSSVTHLYNQTGVFQSYLVVTTQSGCTDTSFLTPIQVGEQYTLSLTANPTSACPGDTITLTGSVLNGSADSINLWRFSNGLGTIPNPNDSNSVSYIFSVDQINQVISLSSVHNACPSSVSVPPIVCLQPRARIHYRNYCDSAFKVQFYDSSQNVDNVRWDFGDGTTSTLKDPSHTYSSTGDYRVVLRAEKVGSPCPLNYDTLIIKIRDVKADFTFDTIACRRVPHQLDASASLGVFEGCYDGYTWSFSDSSMRPITTQNPQVDPIFNLRGIQDITLVVKDVNGCRDTLTQQIDIYGVDANFSMSDTNICAPGLVNFTNLSNSDTIITSYQWLFGDGNVDSILDPSHTYATFQNVNEVQLIVLDSLGCTDTTERIITMYQPFSNLSISDQTLCLGDSASFSATDYTQQGSNLNFNWSFGNGDTSKLQNLTYLYPAAGNFNLFLTIEEQSSGCLNTYSRLMQVVESPIAGFSTSNDSSKFICPNENVIFTDTSFSPLALSYQWDFGNGRASTFQNPGTVYLTNGDYLVQMKIEMAAPFGCVDSISRLMRVKGPVGNFSTDLGQDTICRLDSVLFTIKDTADVEQYTWDFGDGTTVSNQSPIYHQYTFVPPSGQTFAKLILSNADGSCPATIDTVINIYEVIADFRRNNGLDTAYCFAPVQLTNLSTSATNWNWDFGDGNQQNRGGQFIYEYDSAGTYDITLSVSNQDVGCNDSTVKQITLFPKPEIELKGDTICEGDQAVLQVINANPFWTYKWNPTPLVDFTGDSSAQIQLSPPITTNFIVQAIDTNGCLNQDTTFLFVMNDLKLSDFDTTIVIGDVLTLPVVADASLYNFTWTPTEGLSCLDCLPPNIQPLEDVFYNLKIQDVLGCFSYDVNFDVKLHPETFIKMPTSFSPNGDGVNDLVFVEGWGIRELLSYQIYNRWGELVFETSNREEGWDGNYKGKPQNNDVYVYKVRVTTWRDEEKTLEGYLNLMR